MKIYHNQLSQTLQQDFKPVWLVFGDEPWQKNNSLIAIKAQAKSLGFTETIRFSADNSFDWQQLIDEYLTMSLFARLRVIEVELTSHKIVDAASKALLTLCERLSQDLCSANAPNDVVFIFHGPKLDMPTANRKWFKKLTQLGCYLPLYDIELKSLPKWLNGQARQLKLNLAPEVHTLLIELFEGNLLALSQELQKLSLLFSSAPISLEQAEPLLIKQAKFNPFQVIDALLLGDCKRCISILAQQQHEGSTPGQFIWLFHKEIKQLYAMLNQMAHGENLSTIYKEHRIWDKRKPLYQHALTHIKLLNVKRAMARIAEIDLISKTSSEFNLYILLADLAVTLYHGEFTQKLSLDYG